MLRCPPSNGAVALNDSGAAAVLQEDGSIKTWGPSATADPVTTLPSLPGVKGVFAHPDGDPRFLCLLETGSLFTVDPSTGVIEQVNLFWPVGITAPTSDVLDQFLALAGCTGGSGMYVNSAHEFVCPLAKTTTTHAILDAPYYLAGVQHVACNDDVAIVVMDDGTLQGWGNDTHGMLTFPGGLTDAVEVAVGAAHAVARKADGTVVAWGDNTDGQTTVPGGLTGITQISAHALGNFTLALKSDGTVHAWGQDTSGQVTGAASITAATRVSAGKRHAVAVTTGSSTTVAWGDNSAGQTSIATNGSDAAAGNDDTLLIQGAFLQYYGASSPPSTYLHPLTGDPFFGATHTRVYRIADQFVARGGASPGTSFNWRLYVYPNPGLFGHPAQNVAGLSVSNSSNICSVLFNAPDGGTNNIALPYFLGGFGNGNEAYGTNTSGSQIAACSGGVLQAIVDAGDISFWGISTMLSKPIVTGFPGNGTKTWVQVALGTFAAAALADDGTVSAWGDNTSGAASVPGGLGSVRSLAVIPVASGTSSDDTFIVLLNDGTLAVWGFSASALTAEGLTAETDVAAITVAEAGHVVLVLRKDRSIGIYSGSSFPTPYTSTNMAAAAVKVQGNDAALLKVSGEVVALGTNAAALCTMPNWPKTVQALHAAGATRYMAENTDGTLAEWSVANNHATGAFVCPFDLSDLVDYDGNDSVSLGVLKQAGFSSGGAIVAWGTGAGSVSIPSGLAPGGSGLSLNPVMKVRCGSAHYVAMRADGSITVWGDNSKNQITNAPGGNGFDDIAAGFQTCFALKSGTVTAWGSTTSGATSADSVTGVSAIASNSSVDWVALLISGNPTVYGFPGFKAAAASPNNPSWTGIVDIALGNCQVLGRHSDGTLLQWAPVAGGTASPVKALPTGLPAMIGYCPTNRGGMAVDASNVVHVWDKDPRYPVAPANPSKIQFNGINVFLPGKVGSIWYTNPDGSLGGIGNSSLLPPPAGLGPVLAFGYYEDTVNGSGVIQTTDSIGCAITASGAVVLWGTGTSFTAWTPTKPLTDVRLNLCGGDGIVIMGLCNDSTVQMYSDGGSSPISTVPGGLTGVDQIELGASNVIGHSYCVARKSDGTLSLWGESSNTVTGATPGGLSGVTKIAVALDHMLALKSDHSVAAWGTDTGGNVSSANGQTNVADIATNHGTALLYQDGSIGSWPTSVSPVQPTGVSGALAVSCGDSNNSFAVIRADHSVDFWGSSLPTPTDFGPVTVDGPITANSAFMRLGALTLAASITATGKRFMDIAIDESLAFADAELTRWIQLVAERLSIGEQPVTLLSAINELEGNIGFADLARIAFKMLIAETMQLLGEPAAWKAMAIALADSLALASGTYNTLDANVLVAAAMAFGDKLARQFPNTLADGVVFSAEQAAQLQAMLKLLDAMRVSDAATPQVQFNALVDESFAIDAAVSASASLRILIEEGIDLLAQIVLDDGVYLAWVLNTESRSFTRYSNFNFNSFAKIGDKYYGARDDGLYLLEGDDDAGSPINAFLRGGLSDFGTGLLKRAPSLYLGYRADGQMVMKVTAINAQGIREEHWYSLEDRPSGALREGRVKIGRGLKSTYFGWELANVDGGDFGVDVVAWYPMVLERRID